MLTVKEAAEAYVTSDENILEETDFPFVSKRDAFIAGAKYMAERAKEELLSSAALNKAAGERLAWASDYANAQIIGDFIKDV